MHFDEVYHARTATEFLQDWRYGLAHDIYEWTHPHLAKYAMAAGMVLWGEDDVAATSDLDVPVVAAAVEPRRIDEAALRRPGRRAAPRRDRDRDPDLRPRSRAPTRGHRRARGERAGHRRRTAGSSSSATTTVGSRRSSSTSSPTPARRTASSRPSSRRSTIRSTHLLVTDDGDAVVAASSDRLTTVDLSTGDDASDRSTCRASPTCRTGGSGSALVATVDDIDDPAGRRLDAWPRSSAARRADYQARLDAAAPGTTRRPRQPGRPARRGRSSTRPSPTRRSPGVRVETVERVAVATAAGVTFIDPERGLAHHDDRARRRGPRPGAASPASTTRSCTRPPAPRTTRSYDVIAVGGDAAKDGPADKGRQPGPQPAARASARWSPTTRPARWSTSSAWRPDAAADGPWTVYVVEPHGNAVFADARLPDGFVPAAWAADFNPMYPSEDRQQLLVFDGDGASAAIDTGSHAFAWRLPGVIAGRADRGPALPARPDPVPAAARGRPRRAVRPVRRDVLRPVPDRHERRLRRAVHRRRLHPVRGDLDGLVARPRGVLARDAGHRRPARAGPGEQVGRGLRDRRAAAADPRPQRARAGAGDPRARSRSPASSATWPSACPWSTARPTRVRQPDVPADHGRADPARRRRRGPPPDRLDRRGDGGSRSAPRPPSARVVFFGALAAGRLDTTIIDRVAGGHAAARGDRARASGRSSSRRCSRSAAGSGSGRSPRRPRPTTRSACSSRPAPPPEGWLRPGWLLGLPVVWMAVCLVAIPLVVYVVVVHPVGDDRGPPARGRAGRPATPARRCST